MTIAIIKSGNVINAALFADIATAQAFLTAGVWQGADAVVELPDGYGIGDSYDAATGDWTKAPMDEPEPEPIPETYTVDDYLLDLDYRLSLLELEGGV